jgi:hypothetical protein
MHRPTPQRLNVPAPHPVMAGETLRSLRHGSRAGARTTPTDSGQFSVCRCGSREPVSAVCCRGSAGGRSIAGAAQLVLPKRRKTGRHPTPSTICRGRRGMPDIRRCFCSLDRCWVSQCQHFYFSDFLEPGKLADLAVLSRDIFRVAAGDLRKTESVLTMVGSKIVYH